jgi:hypothetical protein
MMPVLKTDRVTAERSYDLEMVRWKGFDPDLRLNANALRTMSAALVSFGTIASVPDVATMVDTSYVAEALR